MTPQAAAVTLRSFNEPYEATPPVQRSTSFSTLLLGKHSLKRSRKVFGDVAVAEVVATVSWHLLHLPLTSSILCQFPELQLFCEANAQ